MEKRNQLYRKIRAKIISFLKKIILDMTMSEWDPELLEEKIDYIKIPFFSHIEIF